VKGYERTPVAPGGRRIPNLYKRRKGGGEVFEYVGRVDGKQVSRVLAATTVGEAKQEIHDLHAGTLTMTGTLSLADLAADYLESMQARVGHRDEKRRRSQKTVDAARQRLTYWVLPALGHRPADSLTTSDLRRLVDSMSDYAPATVSGTLNVLSRLLEFGVKEQVVTRNVVRDLDKDDRPGCTRATEPRYLTPAEVDLLLHGTHEVVTADGRKWDAPNLSDTFRPIAAVCAYAGLRVSEALGLTWQDVDLKGTLTVRQQLGEDGSLVPLKTEAARRTLDIFPALASELRALRDRQAKTSGFHRIGVDSLVFTTSTGKPHSRRNVLRAVHGAGDSAGLNDEGEKVGVHDLRHTFAAALVAAGLTPTESARIMGHRSPLIFLQRYAGLAGDDLTVAFDKLKASGFGR
jgi:integrase